MWLVSSHALWIEPGLRRKAKSGGKRCLQFNRFFEDGDQVRIINHPTGRPANQQRGLNEADQQRQIAFYEMGRGTGFHQFEKQLSLLIVQVCRGLLSSCISGHVNIG